MSIPTASRGLLLAGMLIASGCGREARHEKLLPAETFHWIRQPIAFSPPPARWYREGDNGAGKLGVRFVLGNGGGQCISVAGHRWLDERDRRADLARLAGRIDTLSQREFLHEVSLARARTDDPVSERDGATALAINAALDRATHDYLEGDRGFTANDLDVALRAARSYQPTLEEVLPRLRLRPERTEHPDYWRLGRERDTVLAGMPAFASDDTLVLPEQTLLYTQVFWVVSGCAFEATFQGRPENLETFHRVVDSIRFPGADGATP
jgi:hypothetical protein